jgi:hypothetical protein
MRLDHVSYVASHDQISDVVNRIGSQIGTAFVDGGIHPKFGTRNFTAPLLNGQYIEVVCPLDHPATDATPFGNAVKKKADAGGGWLAWVIQTENIAMIEKKLGRSSVASLRRKPDGTELHWNQIGVRNIFNNNSIPYFIQWRSKNHPSTDGKPNAYLKAINLDSKSEIEKSLLKKEIQSSIMPLTFGSNTAHSADNLIGIVSVLFEVEGKITIID